MWERCIAYVLTSVQRYSYVDSWGLGVRDDSVVEHNTLYKYQLQDLLEGQICCYGSIQARLLPTCPHVSPNMDM